MEPVDAASEIDELEDPQPRASHHPKKTQKHEKPTHISFNGPVTISGDLIVGHEARDDRRRQPSPPVTRRSTGRLQPEKRRPITQCDSESDSTDSEEDLSSPSHDSASLNGPSRRNPNPKVLPDRLRVHSGRRIKRYQPDEGYHTSGTASYGAELRKQSPKGKGRALAPKARNDSAAQVRLSSTAEVRKTRIVESESSRLGGESDSEGGSADLASDVNGIAEDDDADEDADEDASDEVHLPIPRVSTS